MNSNPTILIVAGLSRGYSRSVMHGVLRFARERTDWECVQMEPPLGRVQRTRPLGPVAGIIAEARSSRDVAALDRLASPAVIVTGAARDTQLPQVIADNTRVGQLAFEHFQSLGFKHFAFASWPGSWFGDVRGNAFRRAVSASGARLQPGLPPRPKRRQSDRRLLTNWLRGLADQTAIFVNGDQLASSLILAARSANIAVPEQVAILGVDNDELVCELTAPPLSSIDNATHQIGYRAAEILQQQMAEQRPYSQPIVLPPAGVVARQSTEILAAEQPRMVAALRYIRQLACEGITVPDVLRHAPGSRRALERECKRVLGRTLQQEITRIRIERAKQLLRETNLSTLDIATEVAISSASQFSVIFKRTAGITPRDYRAQFT